MSCPVLPHLVLPWYCAAVLCRAAPPVLPHTALLSCPVLLCAGGSSSEDDDAEEGWGGGGGDVLTGVPAATLEALYQQHLTAPDFLNKVRTTDLSL